MSSSLKIYDLEVFPNYFLAGFKDVETGDMDFFRIMDIQDGPVVNEGQALIGYISDKWLIGYNSRDYDNQLIHYLIKAGPSLLGEPAGFINDRLYKLSVDIIENNLSTYKWDLPFKALDLKRIGNIDKSLKLCGVDLKWKNIQDLIRPHDERVTADELTDIRDYNINDLGITHALYHELRDEIIMRQELSLQYEVDLMDYADSGLADRLLEKFYAERTGIPVWEFRKHNTPRGDIPLKECISDKVRFKTPKMRKLLEQIKSETVNVDDKFHKRLLIGSTYYDMLKGGLHSVRDPEVFNRSADVDLVDADVSSYYPQIMINERVKPEHLSDAFLDILLDVTRTRLKAKAKDAKSAKAKGLKITVNSVFGKMGFKYSWMYDPKAMFTVTINGQLYLLMLIELLEDAGFEVFYANTDGITTKVPKSRRAEYDYICKSWQEYTGFELEFEEFNKCVIRDVNNYIMEEVGGDLKMKGAFDTKRWKDLKKGYEYPIVPIAAKRELIDGIPITETIQNHKDILDFCMAQKPGKKFSIYYYWTDGDRLIKSLQQNTNRYYIGKGGGSLVKETPHKKIQMVAGEPVILHNRHYEAESYNIKHSYYIQEAYKLVAEFKSKQQSLF